MSNQTKLPAKEKKAKSDARNKTSASKGNAVSCSPLSFGLLAVVVVVVAQHVFLSQRGLNKHEKEIQDNYTMLQGMLILYICSWAPYR